MTAASTFDIVSWGFDLSRRLDDLPEEEWEGVLGAEIDAFGEDLTAKMDALAWVSDHLDSQADVIALRVAQLSDRKKAFRNQRERVRGLMMNLLEANEELTGATKVTTPTRTVYIGTSKSLTVPDDPADWPVDLVREEVVRRLDKAAAKKRVQAGEELEGFALVTKRGVRCR